MPPLQPEGIPRAVGGSASGAICIGWKTAPRLFWMIAANYCDAALPSATPLAATGGALWYVGDDRNLAVQIDAEDLFRRVHRIPTRHPDAI